MLRAIVSDLSEVAETVVPLDPRFSTLVSEASETVQIDVQETLWGQWIAAARECDAALIVAPESDGVLAKAVAMLRARGSTSFPAVVTFFALPATNCSRPRHSMPLASRIHCTWLSPIGDSKKNSDSTASLSSNHVTGVARKKSR